MAISVIIIEDDSNIREYLSDAITSSPLCQLLGSAKNLQEGLDLVVRVKADVFLIDLGLPDGDGLDIIKQVAKIQPEAQSLVLSAFGNMRHILSSFEAGATGYIHKSEMPADVVKQVVQVFNGTSPVSSNIAKLLIQKILQPEHSDEAQKSKALQQALNLSNRELEILNALKSSRSVKEIASAFNISKHTVNQHLRSIYSKMGVRSRMSAVNEAMKYERL